MAGAAAEAAAHDLCPEGAADALPSLAIARAVVQEALRLYPRAFIIVRQALAVNGLNFPEKCRTKNPWLAGCR
jgi:hypothetical protein